MDPQTPSPAPNQNPNPTPAAPPTPPAPAPAQPVAATTNTGTIYAGFWRRFVAALIDGILLSVILSPLSSMFLNGAKYSYSWSLIQFLVGAAYAVALLSTGWQATIGKKVLGIKVTDEGGNKPQAGKLVIRELMKFVSAAILLIGYLMMLWDKRKQTLHDKVAHTLVVKS